MEKEEETKVCPVCGSADLYYEAGETVGFVYHCKDCGYDSCGPKACEVEIKQLKVDSLFLSSAVSGDPDKVTERMIESVSLLRSKYRFNGYVHFKVLPGTSYEELIKIPGNWARDNV